MEPSFRKSLAWFLRQLFHPFGRLSRIEYINTQLINFMLSIGLLVLFEKLKWSNQIWAMILFLLVFASLLIMTAIKRLNDLSEPLERLMYSILPIVCVYYWLELVFRAGQVDVNQAGEAPAIMRFTSSWMIFQCLLPLFTLGAVFLLNTVS
jgi:uncharacterized membrane protein YhaH (DUF805 family)